MVPALGGPQPSWEGDRYAGPPLAPQVARGMQGRQPSGQTQPVCPGLGDPVASLCKLGIVLFLWAEVAPYHPRCLASRVRAGGCAGRPGVLSGYGNKHTELPPQTWTDSGSHGV